jgi:hypothetical protein
MTTDHQARQRLYYQGTEIPVIVGDRVVVKSLFGRKRNGVVTYVPGQSKVHSEMEGPGFAQWAITLDDEAGTTLVWTYAPDQLQPARRILFVSRGEAPENALPAPDEF